jgi:hypothetical protein
MPSLAPPRFEWHDLPCTAYNKNRAFAIYTPKIETMQDIVLPDLGVTWTGSPDYVKKVERVRSGLKDWKLRYHAKAGQGRMWYYGYPQSEDERFTPFRQWPVRRMHYWPTVLLKLWFEVYTDSNDGEHLLDHAKFRDGDTYPTTFIIRQFLSDEPWPKERFSRIMPITDSVRWNFLSNQGSFPECLHPRCEFPSFRTPGEVLFNAGTVGDNLDAIAEELESQVFPATPMTDWEKYAVEITTQQVLGQWFYEEIIALPPIDDREITA